MGLCAGRTGLSNLYLGIFWTGSSGQGEASFKFYIKENYTTEYYLCLLEYKANFVHFALIDFFNAYSISKFCILLHFFWG